MSDTHEAPVELLRILDEKFLVDDAIFRGAQPTGTLFIDPEGLRLPDGSLDLARIERITFAAPGRLLALRQRLRGTPLALTAPAWVPVAGFERQRHIRILPKAITQSDAAVLAGEENLRVDPRQPMWNALVADRGDVIIVTLRVSHALGDGMFGLRVLDAFTTPAPEEPIDPVLTPLEAPVTGPGLLLVTGRSWWNEFRPLGGAWREYWRKPFSRRLRRWVGRARRSVRGVPRFDPSPPGTGARLHHGHAVLELRSVKAAARQAGTSVHNHLVAVTLRVLLEMRDTDEVLLDVPISRRMGNTGDQRNHIVMTQVRGTHGMTEAATTTAVDSIVDLGKQPGPMPPATGRSIGYASYLPWQIRHRYFGTSRVVAAALWPVLAAEHEIAVFGAGYSGAFSLSVSGVSADEVATVLERVRNALEATVDAP